MFNPERHFESKLYTLAEQAECTDDLLNIQREVVPVESLKSLIKDNLRKMEHGQSRKEYYKEHEYIFEKVV